MYKIVFVKDAKHIEDHILFVKFDDGFKGIVDLKDRMRTGLFEELKDIESFKKFKVSKDGVIEWYNGADYSPEALYNLMQEQLKANLQLV